MSGQAQAYASHLEDEIQTMKYRLSYEFVRPDPFYHGGYADLRTIKQNQLKQLSTKPVLLAPLLDGFYWLVYKAYWTVFMGLVWLGYAVGDQLRELTPERSTNER